MGVVMVRKVEAVYEHGMLRPLEPLALTESQRVKLTISDVPGARSQRDLNVVDRARAELAKVARVPTIEEVRAALASIPGSLSQDVIADRGDY
jgi:predicted DNA-binding antitoxin AbrB/MazE fold protein